MVGWWVGGTAGGGFIGGGLARGEEEGRRRRGEREWRDEVVGAEGSDASGGEVMRREMGL